MTNFRSLQFVSNGCNVVQVFLQEAQEFQTGIDDLRYRRRAAGGLKNTAAALSVDPRPPDSETIHAMLLIYSKALQHALQVLNTSSC